MIQIRVREDLSSWWLGLAQWMKGFVLVILQGERPKGDPNL